MKYAYMNYNQFAFEMSEYEFKINISCNKLEHKIKALNYLFIFEDSEITHLLQI